MNAIIVARASKPAMLALALAACALAHAQSSYTRQRVTEDIMTRPFPPVRIIGNVYHVGTYDLASYLIATAEGHILVNTGVYDSAPLIHENVEALGYDFEDIRILLTTQAHWDHVADLAEIKRLTGARLLAHEGDVASLENGGVSDFRFPEGREPVFEPVEVDEVLQDGDTVEIGGTVVTLLHHPGHTKGASSFMLTVEEGGEPRDVLIVNMGTINPGVKLLDMPAYPGIAEAYAATFVKQKALMPDVWVSSHARHFGLHERFEPGDPYAPGRFADLEAYRAKIGHYEQLYLTQLAEEHAERGNR